MKKEGSMDGTKIRSPEGLTRCGTCRRHVVAGDRPSTTRCPFCGVHAARSFRGSAIAGALVMAACSGGEPEPPPTEPVAVETQTETVPTAAVPELPEETPTPEPAVEPEEPVVEANVAPAEGAERPSPPEPAPVEPAPEPEADEFAEEAPRMRPVARYGLAPMDSFREGSPMVRAPRYGRAPMPRKD